MRSVVSAVLADVVPSSCVDGPGNRFVVFVQGCNFDCIACHNPQTIPMRCRPEQEVETVVEQIRRAAPFLSGVTVSGGEATLQADFVHDLFAALKADPELSRLTRFVDSNGSAEAATWLGLAPVMDGVMIDLKCFDDAIHTMLTGRSNRPVLASIELLHLLGLLYEVRLLLIGDVNDDPRLLAETARWLAEVDPTMRVTLIGFRRHGVRPRWRDLREPSPEDLQRAADVLRSISPFHLAVI